MTPTSMKELFIRALKREDTIFENYDEAKENMVVLCMKGDNLDEVNVYVSFSELDSGAMLCHIGCYDLPNFSKHYAIGIKTCNDLNDDTNARFYIDSDGDAVVSMSVFFNAYGIYSEYVPEQVLTYATMIAINADNAYPILEKAKWS